MNYFQHPGSDFILSRHGRCVYVCSVEKLTTHRFPYSQQPALCADRLVLEFGLSSWLWSPYGFHFVGVLLHFSSPLLSTLTSPSSSFACPFFRLGDLATARSSLATRRQAPVLAFPACYWLSGMRHKAEVSRERTDDKGAWIVRQMGDKIGRKKGCWKAMSENTTWLEKMEGGSFVWGSFVL